MLKRRETDASGRDDVTLVLGGGIIPGLLTLVCVAAMLALAPAMALAQDGDQFDFEDPIEERAAEKNVSEATLLDCKDMATRTGAQSIFDLYPTIDRFALDADNDGRACEIPAGSTTTEDGTTLGAATGGDLRDCNDFVSQAAAQSHLRANPSDPYDVDVENTGIACEITPMRYDDTTRDVTPVEGAISNSDLDCDDFEYQEEAQAVYFGDETDPNNLDASAGDDGSEVCLGLPTLASNSYRVSADFPEENGEGGPAVLQTPTLLAQVLPTEAVDRAALLLQLCAVLLVVSGAGTLFVVWRKHGSSDLG